MRTPFRAAGLLLAATLPLSAASAAPHDARPVARAIARLEAATPGDVAVALSPATGVARFVRATADAKLPVPGAKSAAPTARAAAFLAAHGDLFGIRDVDAELRLDRVADDGIGATHVRYAQVHRGLPVWAGELRLHFDLAGDLVAVNGLFVPGIALDVRADVPPARARAIARTAAAAVTRFAERRLRVERPELVVYRTGLDRGRPGLDHLAWAVLATAPGVRERVFVDAHDGSVVDRFSEIAEALEREVYVGGDAAANLAWKEGNRLPYSGSGSDATDAQVNELVTAAKDAYDLFANLSGGRFLGWDGRSPLFKAVLDPPSLRGSDCPNANWDGQQTNFCAGFVSDDVAVHEWTHAYSQGTHRLGYRNQVGALNEATSDVFGEALDLLDGRGRDTPDTPRTDACSSAVPTNLTVIVDRPASIAGSYRAGRADFGPQLASAIAGDVVAALDAADTAGPSTTDGCSAFANAAQVAGRVALVDRGTCEFDVKVKNAERAGAIAAVVVNNAGNAILTMAGDDTSVAIPSAFLGSADGAKLRRESGVHATLAPPPGGDPSVRWLMGEDLGGVRDLWNPGCLGGPGAMGDPLFYCGDADNGGVHVNSGVPSHAFALAVDGGTFRGTAVAPIGLTKALAIWWRAMDVYQNAATDFADHADALERSCADLRDARSNLPDPRTGAASGQVVSAADCNALAAAIAAVALRAPEQCVVTPLLDPHAPPRCATGTPASFFEASFESGAGAWTVTSAGADAGSGAGVGTPIPWRLASPLPGGRSGTAFFAADPADANGCPSTVNAAGTTTLASPEFAIPAGVTAPKLAFAHYVATEPGIDGGQLEVRIGGGAPRRVESADLTFNPYTVRLGDDTGNPLAGQPAWSGTDGNSSGGTWAETQVDLAPYAGAGDRVQLRWVFGANRCDGREGWYVDDVAAYSCTSGASTCVPDASTLCLLGGRYRAQVTWENQFNGARGAGKAVRYADLTGFFAFEDPANLELVVKLLDFGDVVKLFYGQLTNLKFTLTVTDTRTGTTRTYRNGEGDCGGIDDAAFPKLAGDLAKAGTCHAAGDRLCLLDGRFAVDVDWRNQFSGDAGHGKAKALTDLSGLFTFTDDRNVEVLAKTLDFGDRVLFLYGSLSNLEYTLHVTDTATGATKTYANPAGRFCGGIDPNAF